MFYIHFRNMHWIVLDPIFQPNKKKVMTTVLPPLSMEVESLDDGWYAVQSDGHAGNGGNKHDCANSSPLTSLGELGPHWNHLCMSKPVRNPVGEVWNWIWIVAPIQFFFLRRSTWSSSSLDASPFAEDSGTAIGIDTDASLQNWWIKYFWQKTIRFQNMCTWKIILDQTKCLCRSIGLHAASFEIGDRPVYENFLGGLGCLAMFFLYQLSSVECMLDLKAGVVKQAAIAQVGNCLGVLHGLVNTQFCWNICHPLRVCVCGWTHTAASSHCGLQDCKLISLGWEQKNWPVWKRNNYAVLSLCEISGWALLACSGLLELGLDKQETCFQIRNDFSNFLCKTKVVGSWCFKTKIHMEL